MKTFKNENGNPDLSLVCLGIPCSAFMWEGGQALSCLNSLFQTKNSTSSHKNVLFLVLKNWLYVFICAWKKQCLSSRLCSLNVLSTLESPTCSPPVCSIPGQSRSYLYFLGIQLEDHFSSKVCCFEVVPSKYHEETNTFQRYLLFI